MCHDLLRDSSFYALLKRIDQAEAERVRAERCKYCGGPLHSANYHRTLMGLHPVDPLLRRLSFCCASCRRRTSPPSVRFLKGRLFPGMTVVLAAALRHGPSRKRIEEVARVTGADRRTIERWCRWWRDTFGRCRFWVQARAQLDHPVPPTELPSGLLDRFAGECRERLLNLLRWLLPITGSGGAAALAF